MHDDWDSEDFEGICDWCGRDTLVQKTAAPFADEGVIEDAEEYIVCRLCDLERRDDV